MTTVAPPLTIPSSAPELNKRALNSKKLELSLEDGKELYLSLEQSHIAKKVSIPEELVVYSTKKTGEQKINEIFALRYLDEPSPGELNQKVNLAFGFRLYKKNYKDIKFQTPLNNLLNAIMYYENNENDGKPIEAQIIAQRGTLVNLCMIPYNNAKYWDLSLKIQYFDGQVFIEVDEKRNEILKNEYFEKIEKINQDKLKKKLKKKGFKLKTNCKKRGGRAKRNLNLY